MEDWVVHFKDFLCSAPKIGEDEPILTSLFQMGWNHQVVEMILYS